jgi:hypothetical protein
MEKGRKATYRVHVPLALGKVIFPTCQQLSLVTNGRITEEIHTPEMDSIRELFPTDWEPTTAI